MKKLFDFQTPINQLFTHKKSFQYLLLDSSNQQKQLIKQTNDKLVMNSLSFNIVFQQLAITQDCTVQREYNQCQLLTQLINSQKNVIIFEPIVYDIQTSKKVNNDLLIKQFLSCFNMQDIQSLHFQAFYFMENTIYDFNNQLVQQTQSISQCLLFQEKSHSVQLNNQDQIMEVIFKLDSFQNKFSQLDGLISNLIITRNNTQFIVSIFNPIFKCFPKYSNYYKTAVQNFKTQNQIYDIFENNIQNIENDRIFLQKFLLDMCTKNRNNCVQNVSILNQMIMQDYNVERFIQNYQLTPYTPLQKLFYELIYQRRHYCFCYADVIENDLRNCSDFATLILSMIEHFNQLEIVNLMDSKHINYQCDLSRILVYQKSILLSCELLNKTIKSAQNQLLNGNVIQVDTSIQKTDKQCQGNFYQLTNTQIDYANLYQNPDELDELLKIANDKHEAQAIVTNLQQNNQQIMQLSNERQFLSNQQQSLDSIQQQQEQQFLYNQLLRIQADIQFQLNIINMHPNIVAINELKNSNQQLQTQIQLLSTKQINAKQQIEDLNNKQTHLKTKFEKFFLTNSEVQQRLINFKNQLNSSASKQYQ